jgi:hypothetical protein
MKQEVAAFARGVEVGIFRDFFDQIAVGER